jgi:hypothetical protein
MGHRLACGQKREAAMHSGEIEISQLHRFCAPQLGSWIQHQLSAVEYAKRFTGRLSLHLGIQT